MPLCQMLKTWRSSKPNPMGFEDFDVEVNCEKPATKRYKHDTEPSVCQDCHDAMVEDDASMANEFVEEKNMEENEREKSNEVLQTWILCVDVLRAESARLTPQVADIAKIDKQAAAVVSKMLTAVDETVAYFDSRFDKTK